MGEIVFVMIVLAVPVLSIFCFIANALDEKYPPNEYWYPVKRHFHN
jgi:hypothetical protein